MKHRRRSMRARRRRPAISYRVRWKRALAIRRAFEAMIPRIVELTAEAHKRRADNRRRKGKPDLMAIDRRTKPFLSFLTGKP